MTETEIVRLFDRASEAQSIAAAASSPSRKRQVDERDALVAKQLGQRAVLQTEIKALRRDQAERLRDLRGEVGRFLTLAKGPAEARDRAPGLGLER